MGFLRKICWKQRDEKNAGGDFASGIFSLFMLYFIYSPISHTGDKMEIICEFYESYSREELWFDDKTNQFSLRLNCWGAVDDEEHCVGTQETDAFNALKMLISYNYLDIVLQYSS